MKVFIRILITVVVLLALILIIGFSLPGEKMVSRTMVFDKMYFFVMADISSHYNEASWRSDLDTVIQQEDIDGLQVWMEKYTDGDSALIKTLKTTEFDLVREVVAPDGKDRLRIIQIKDIDGKTAIKMSEEVYIRNPLIRVWYLFDDQSDKFVSTYLSDLKTKYENEPEDDNMW